MWSTHPPSREREAAARAHWLEAPDSPEDGYTAWTLFSEPEALRQRMTMSMTRAAHPQRAIRFTQPDAVSVLLADERLAQVASQRDLGAYDQRRFARLPIDRIFIPRPALHRATLTAAHAELYGAEHQTRAARVTERRETLKTLASAVGHATREGEEMPPLPNLPPHASTGPEGPLARILFPEPPIDPARFDEDDPRPVLDALGRVIGAALDRTARLRQKSIAALLEEQDRIAARFLTPRLTCVEP